MTSISQSNIQSCLQTIAKAAMNGAPLPHLLKEITAGARLTTGSEEAAVYLIDKTRRRLSLSTEHSSEASSVPVELDSLLAANLPNSSREIAKIIALSSEGELSPTFATPIISEQKTLGFLCTTRISSQDATIQEAEGFLRTLADIAGESLRTRQPFILASGTSATVEALGSPGLGLNTRAALKDLVNQVRIYAKADIAALYFTNPTSSKVSLDPIFSGQLRYAGVTLKKRDDDSLHGKPALSFILRRKESVYADDAQEIWQQHYQPHTTDEPNFITRERILSSAGIPVKAGDTTFGVLFVHYRSKIHFDARRRQLIEITTGGIAVALYNIFLADLLALKQTVLESLSKISAKIARPGKGLKEILTDVLQAAMDVSSSEFGVSFLADKRSRLLEVFTSVGIEVEPEKEPLQWGHGLAGKAAIEAQPIRENRFQQNKHHYRSDSQTCLFKGRRVSSLLAVPIIYKDSVLGVLELGSLDESYRFEELHTTLLSQFASLAASAIIQADNSSFRRAMVRHNPEAIIAVNASGYVTEFNPPARAIMGFSRDEVIGEPVGDFYWMGEKEARKIGTTLRREHLLRNYETAVKTRTDKRVPIYLSASALEDSDGRFIGSIGILEDMRLSSIEGGTIRKLLDAMDIFVQASSLGKAADEVLMQSLRIVDGDNGVLLIENTSGWKIEASTLGKNVLANHSLSQLPKRILRQPKDAILWSKKEPEETPELAQYRLTDEGKCLALIPLWNENSLIAIMLLESESNDHFTPDPTLFSVLSKHAGIVINRLQLQELQSKTQQGLLRAANAFTSSILASAFAHELKNGLNSIATTCIASQTFLQRLASQGKALGANSEVFLDLERIESEVERVARLARQIQGSSLNKLSTELAPCHLNEVVTESLEVVETALRLKKMKLELKLDTYFNRPKHGKGNPIPADVDQVKQVFVNLCINAIHASRKRGRIMVSTFIKGSYAAISVQDYGAGISDNDRRRLFDPFFTTKAEGTGLGLYICRTLIADNHNGRIEFSTQLGKGSNFVVLLPH